MKTTSQELLHFSDTLRDDSVRQVSWLENKMSTHAMPSELLYFFSFKLSHNSHNVLARQKISTKKFRCSRMRLSWPTFFKFFGFFCFNFILVTITLGVADPVTRHETLRSSIYPFLIVNLAWIVWYPCEFYQWFCVVSSQVTDASSSAPIKLIF